MTDQIRVDTLPKPAAGNSSHVGPTNQVGDLVPDRIETADALRSAIDGGAGGDKTPVLDPAMSPLGTDDEAGGHTNTPEQVRAAAAQEIRPRVAHNPEERQPTLDFGIILIGLAIVALVGVALLLF